MLELERGRTARLGPDILTERVDASRLRGVDARRELGDVLLDQRVVAGDRQSVEGRSAVAGPRVALAHGWRDVRRGAPARAGRGCALDEDVAGRRTPAPVGLPPLRPSVPAVRHAGRVAGPGGRQPDRVLVSRLSVVDELAARISALPLPARIGVDGVDAAGKTTLADELFRAPARGSATLSRSLSPSASERYRQGRESPRGRPTRTPSTTSRSAQRCSPPRAS